MDTVTIILSPRPSETGTWLAFAESPLDVPTGPRTLIAALADPEKTIGRGSDPCKAVADLRYRMTAEAAGVGAYVHTSGPALECPACLRPLTEDRASAR